MTFKATVAEIINESHIVEAMLKEAVAAVELLLRNGKLNAPPVETGKLCKSRKLRRN